VRRERRTAIAGANTPTWPVRTTSSVVVDRDHVIAIVAKQAWRSGRLAGMKASALLSQKARRLSAQM
jgi:hypothetical protein